MGKKDATKLVHRLHNEAKLKADMREVYEQVKADKELSGCTFVPNNLNKYKELKRRHPAGARNLNRH